MSSITIASATIPNWQGNTTGIVLRLLANQGFTAASGTIYPQSVRTNPASLGTFFLSVACTVSNGELTIPAITLDSTTDSPDNPTATLSAVLFDSTTGQVVQPFGTVANFSLAPTPTTVTWAQIAETQPGITSLIQSGPTVFAIGSVTTLAPGSPATATITGSAPTQELNLGLPQGIQGIQGPVGGNLATTTPVVAAGAGAVGVSTSSARADHEHPTEVAGLAIAPASVSTGGAAVEEAVNALNPIGGVRYWCDSVGNVYMYCDANGVVHFPIGMMIDSVVFEDALITPGVTINDAAISAISAPSTRWMGSSKVITDSVGSVALSVLPDGSVFFPEGVRGKFLAQTAIDSEGMVYYSQLDGSTGLIQLFKSDPIGQRIWQLTSTGNNYAPEVSSDGTRLSWISDRTGVEQTFVGDTWAVVKTPANQDIRTLYKYNHICGTGQSLSIGFASNAISTTTAPFGNLMLNGGVRPVENGANAPVASSNITSLVPLVEASVEDTTGTAVDGETICSGMVNRLSADMMGSGIFFTSIASVSGIGGQAYVAIRKGGTEAAYANTIAEVTAATALAAAAGVSYAVRAVFLIHGEADQIANTGNYDQYILQLQANYNTDLKAITGQSTDIPLLFCQISEWTNPEGGDVAIATIPYAQLAAHEAAPGKCILVGPKYHLPYGATPHLTADGYRRHGEYYGKVMERVIGQGKSWRPLSPRKIQRSGNQILVTFWVPVEPLVIDTTNVTPPTYNPNGLNGFEYFDNSGSPPAITAVSVVSPTSVLITLASAPTVPVGAGFIRYAYTGVLGQFATGTAGASGPRGCLRDSDTSTSFYTDSVLATHYQMFNWCVHFNKAC